MGVGGGQGLKVPTHDSPVQSSGHWLQPEATQDPTNTPESLCQHKLGYDGKGLVVNNKAVPTQGPAEAVTKKMLNTFPFHNLIKGLQLKGQCIRTVLSRKFT